MCTKKNQESDSVFADAINVMKEQATPENMAAFVNTSTYAVISQLSANLRKSLEKGCEHKIDSHHISQSFKGFLESHNHPIKVGTSYGSSLLNGVAAQFPAIRSRDMVKEEYGASNVASAFVAASTETVLGGPMEVLASRPTVQKYNPTINTLPGVARLSVAVSPYFFVRNLPTWLLANSDMSNEQKGLCGSFAGMASTIPDSFASFVMSYYNKTNTYEEAVKLSVDAMKKNPRVLLLSAVPRACSIAAGTILLSQEAQEHVGDFIKEHCPVGMVANAEMVKDSKSCER